MSPLAFIGQRVLSYRRCNLTALILVTGFALLVVLPFFALGLHQEPAVSVARGGYDPKGFPFFQTPLGGWSRIAGMLAALLGRFFLPLLGVRLAYTLLRHSRRWTQRRQRLGFASLLIVLAACAFMFSPLGGTIVSWYFD